MPELTIQAIAEELLPAATRHLVRTADGLTDEEYAEPSGLPDWTRAHVLAHLALNAEGLAAALSGIAEGEATPMYASQEARDGDIAALAECEPGAIRSRLLGATTDLADAIAALPEDTWGTVVERVPGGRSFPASEVPGMRLREVEIHHADLAAGYGRGSWPATFTELLLDGMAAKTHAGGFRAHATDLGRTWEIGAGGPTVTGSSADLAWWLTGRGRGEGLTSDSGSLPRIEAW